MSLRFLSATYVVTRVEKESTGWFVTLSNGDDSFTFPLGGADPNNVDLGATYIAEFRAVDDRGESR